MENRKRNPSFLSLSSCSVLKNSTSNRQSWNRVKLIKHLYGFEKVLERTKETETVVWIFESLHFSGCSQRTSSYGRKGGWKVCTGGYERRKLILGRSRGVGSDLWILPPPLKPDRPLVMMPFEIISSANFNTHLLMLMIQRSREGKLNWVKRFFRIFSLFF
jgi:hypothetical protein